MDLQQLSLQEAIEDFYAGQFVTTSFYAYEGKIMDYSQHTHLCPKCGVTELCEQEECENINSLYCGSCVSLMINEAILETKVNEYSEMVREFEKIEEEYNEAIANLKRVLNGVNVFSKECPF